MPIRHSFFHLRVRGIISFDMGKSEKHCTRAGDFTENLRYVLPVRISEMLFQTPQDKLETVSELRLRIGQPVIVRTGFTENGLGEGGLQREPGTVFSAGVYDKDK